MSPWMFTEIAQLLVTVLVIGGGFAIIMANSIFKLGVDPSTLGFVQGLMTAWSGFWLGAKVQRQIPTSTTTKVGPAESTTTTGQG